MAETIAEAFVRRALAIPDEVAVADRISGVLKYRKLLVAARLFGHRLGQLPEQTVGVMLPASVAADVVFFGLHLAGKLPAMLNWTTGPGNLAHAAEKLGIRHVVTSRKLIDRLGIEIQGAAYLYLEDIRPQIGKLRAIATLLATYLFPRTMLRSLPRQDPEEPAVVLFTSGSESTPKAVPLTHGNLRSNSRAGIGHLDLVPADAMLALLPPFHSFGLLGNVVAPVLGGIRTVYHPDPTDAAGLVRTMAQYRATLLISTPTFLSYMFAIATPDDLRSVRVIVSGGGKMPGNDFYSGRPTGATSGHHGGFRHYRVLAGHCREPHAPNQAGNSGAASRRCRGVRCRSGIEATAGDGCRRTVARSRSVRLPWLPGL